MPTDLIKILAGPSSKRHLNGLLALAQTHRPQDLAARPSLEILQSKVPQVRSTSRPLARVESPRTHDNGTQAGGHFSADEDNLAASSC